MSKDNKTLRFSVAGENEVQISHQAYEEIRRFLSLPVEDDPADFIDSIDFDTSAEYLEERNSDGSIAIHIHYYTSTVTVEYS